MALSPMHLSIVEEAMQTVRIMYPGKTAEEYRRAESRLKTSVVVKVRNGFRFYTLKVGQLTFRRIEVV
jgi:hypothetical protein